MYLPAGIYDYKFAVISSCKVIPESLPSNITRLFQVDRLVLIDASVYAEGTGNLATLPRSIAYAGVRLCLLL